MIDWSEAYLQARVALDKAKDAATLQRWEDAGTWARTAANYALLVEMSAESNLKGDE